MSFKSILKKSLTSGLLQQKLSAPELIVVLLVTVFFAVYILILYRKMTKSTFYSRTFGISLVMLSVVTAGMILSMQANFVITFGMLGSLSLIRFRTSVKGTVDQIFIFWSVSVGLLCGASCYGVALAEVVILTAVLFLLPRTKEPRRNVLLQLEMDCQEAEEPVLALAKEYDKKAQIRGRNQGQGFRELLIRMNIGNADREALLARLNGDGQVRTAFFTDGDGR